ncbi:hypothetical protein I4U23_020017 [Adineta vaga]|nr:hypothetical protein I4U23_020017 [Adineta vaga]
MASFEPTAVIFGCNRSIGSISLRLPVPLLCIFDENSLEQLIDTSPQLTDACLQRYFIILLDSLDKDLLERVERNHRVVAVYKHDQSNRTKNSVRQLTLNLTNDIVRFLTEEGEKQIKLERISLTKIYYQQARTLKEWAMSLFKAEPCHILLIPLNSSQENLDNTQQRLQQICNKIGYTSVVIHQLNDYIPIKDEHISLLPYDKLLFSNDHPNFLCRLIKSLSPIRFYLYGNELSILSEWSKLMISTERDVMDDEDNWCAFLENELVHNEIRWNFAFTYGRQWKVSRVAPTDFNQLDENPRFHSALRRAHVTFAERQIEVTSEIFEWYLDCIANGDLRLEPKLTSEQKNSKMNQRRQFTFQFVDKCRFQNISSFDYARLDSSKIQSISFIWFDEMLGESNNEFDQFIQPFQWTFFNKITNCLAFIETQLREQRYIFLVVSGSLGNTLFQTGICVIKQLFATYIYCAHLDPNLEWARNHSEIHGVFNDSKKLISQIQKDFDTLKKSLGISIIKWYVQSNTTNETKMLKDVENTKLRLPLPITVYDEEQKHMFLAHQRTIDSILCVPHTYESRQEMITEFRRLYSDDETILAEIDQFEIEYIPHAAVQWYTRDSFVCRTINQTLRESNVDAMFKLRYILTDIYTHLNESYRQNNWLERSGLPSTETFYRGQLMSYQEFNSFKELRGSVISINTFLSTTTSMQIALMYANIFQNNSDDISVVFSIESDSISKIRPYANISRYSMFPDEDEVLFAMGSIFQIGNIRELPDAENVWIIYLKTYDLHN